MNDPVTNAHLDCQSCGACCATYRVSFYWAEMEEKQIPEHMVEPITPVYACMQGTNQAKPRCVALSGQLGGAIACSIYPQRPSACHEVQSGDARCLRARAVHGMGFN